jgi:hypothetical protein
MRLVRRLSAGLSVRLWMTAVAFCPLALALLAREGSTG